MTLINWQCISLASVLLICSSSAAQQPPGGALASGRGDLAAIKQKAEAGDAPAQLALADALSSKFRASEALEWYRKAAAQGNIDATYHVGHTLLFGAPGIPKALAVAPNPPEGIRWTFQAATNLHPKACYDMSNALRHGLGTSTNLVAAYAWLSLYAGSPDGSVVGKVHLDELALELDTAALAQAQALATAFKAGTWMRPVIRIIPENDPRLRLDGVTLGGKVPLAIISGQTVAQGESFKLTAPPGPVTITCTSVSKDSASVVVEGEPVPRLLRLR